MGDPFQLLLDDGVVEEVISRLKTGKEAEVYLVQHAGQIVAAKVYKERHARSFKHNAGYKEGRQVRNSRTQRAIDRGSRFGQKSSEEAWKAAESDALYKLHAAGVRVPTPVLFYEGVLLMELVTDAEGRPARRLIECSFTPDQAMAAYVDLRTQVVKMLCQETIHGDLSPYNVLLGAAGPTVIDFPQVVSASHNSRSEQFFRRDLENLREFFARFDPRLSLRAHDAAEIWHAYVRRALDPDYVPPEVATHAPERAHGGHGRRGKRDRGQPRQGEARHHGGRGEHPRQAPPGGKPHGAPRHGERPRHHPNGQPAHPSGARGHSGQGRHGQPLGLGRPGSQDNAGGGQRQARHGAEGGRDRSGPPQQARGGADRGGSSRRQEGRHGEGSGPQVTYVPRAPAPTSHAPKEPSPPVVNPPRPPHWPGGENE